MPFKAIQSQNKAKQGHIILIRSVHTHGPWSKVDSCFCEAVYIIMFDKKEKNNSILSFCQRNLYKKYFIIFCLKVKMRSGRMTVSFYFR